MSRAFVCISLGLRRYAYGCFFWRSDFKKSEVKVNSIGMSESIFMWALTLLVTFLFYFILRYFNTANLIPSTLSVTTSFFAVYLTFRRSPLYAVAYAEGDVILTILWVMASLTDSRYVSVTVCFGAFLLSDIYGFFSWRKMKIRQSGGQGDNRTAP